MCSQALISLKRQDNNQPWGFRLKGGADQGLQLFIEHIQPNGRASYAGLRAGDLVLSICGVPTANLTHAQVKGEILRAGNDIDLVIQRNGEVSVSSHGEAEPGNEPRSVIDEKPLPKLGGPRFKPVQQKTFQVLEEQLQPAASSAGGGASPDAHVADAPRPASIFDRKKQERSDYLVAKGNTI
ncbi:hypothetical protein HELRODRAFT_154200, partial [Helobdella robusta]|uniref:PDZ domain-containing protein n=1 Tax=Helobdella robusta TaxID=6412 RepID=T1ELE0_HELRO